MAAKKRSIAGFATREELKEVELQEAGFRLGEIHPDHGGRRAEAAIDDDRHLFIVAGTRAGKGTTMIIPNLLHWAGGVVCIDPKGENASITAMRRASAEDAAGSGTQVKKHLGQEVFILDPFRIVRGPARTFRVRYDPLSDIEVGEPQESDQILTVAEAVVVSEGDKAKHFSDAAETLLAGLIEAVLHGKSPDKTLTGCRHIFQKGSGELKRVLKEAPLTDAGLAKDALALIEDAGEDEGGGFLTTLSRQLRWLADPRMQSHLSESDMSLVEAVRQGASVYICVPPSRIPRMSRWLRLIVRIALDAKMNSPFEHRGERCLFLLDEFYSLGHMQIIEDAAAYMAGYGIKLLPVIQNIGQVKKLYEKNWETFLGNAGAIIAWGLNDLETEKYISDRMGPVKGWEKSYSETRNLKVGDPLENQGSISASQSQREMAIRWPSEIHADGARKEMRGFVITADGAPFMVQRVEYMSGAHAGLYDSPEAIDAWEAHLPDITRAELDSV